MKLLLNRNLLSAIIILGAVGNIASAGCGGLNEVSVTCKAVDGETERQWPKTYGVPEGTECSRIPLPTNDPKFPHWRECMRTVQFDFHWTYLGTDDPEEEDAKLISIHRRIENNLGVFPEEEVPLVESYWGQRMGKNWALRNTYKQMVVDICLMPITYTYSLDVKIETSDRTTCTDTASYTYEITANEGEKSGYTQFKERPDESATNRVPDDTDCKKCRSSSMAARKMGQRYARRCERQVMKCLQRAKTQQQKCISRRVKKFEGCCKFEDNTIKKVC